MKKPTLTEMQSVPAEFRAMTDAELLQVFDDNQKGLRTYKERDFARFERYRREDVGREQTYINKWGPERIAELESEIRDVQKIIESSRKRIAKLNA